MSLQDKINSAKPTTFLTDGLSMEEVKQAIDEGIKRSMGEFPTQKQEDFARAIEDTTGVPLPNMRTKQAYSQYISENINAYKLERQKRHSIDDYNWKNEVLNG